MAKRVADILIERGARTLVDDQPWRRAYVILAPIASVPFHPRPAGA